MWHRSTHYSAWNGHQECKRSCSVLVPFVILPATQFQFPVASSGLGEKRLKEGGERVEKEKMRKERKKGRKNGERRGKEGEKREKKEKKKEGPKCNHTSVVYRTIDP